MASKKIANDKYYTSKELAKYCVDKTKEIIGEDNITEYIEPSAGAGVFLDYLGENYLAYDIEPEDDRIVKQDYLSLELEYKKGRCIVGNPPFGKANNLSIQFYKKSIQLGDYIVFILPISQYNNTIKCYEFDLIYSEDLDVKEYSNINIHCCLNIYKRPVDGLNKKEKFNYKDIDIRVCRLGKIEKRIRLYDGFKYDFAICTWGSVGKEVLIPNSYSEEFYFIINNEKLRDKILYCLKNTDWIKTYKMTASPNLKIWQVYKYLKEQIPELE